MATLGLGSCRLVELARALVSEPVLLMADEPSSGLDIHETRELANVLRMLQHERGMAMLLVEHDLGMVGEVVDRTVVMNLGTVIADGTFDEVMADPPSATPTSGSRHDRSGRAGPAAEHRGGRRWRIRRGPGPRGRPRERRLRPLPGPFDVTFTVPEAGVTALIGSNGAGKSTVARVVTGLLASTAGTIRLGGQDVTGLPAYKIARAGAAHVPEGRGVFANLTVEENLKLAFRQRGGRQSVPGVARAGLRGLPGAGRAPAPERWHAVRRRAAHPVAGQGAGGPAPTAGGRRDLPGPGPGHDRRRLRRPAQDQRRRHRAAHRRAAGRPGAGDRQHRGGPGARLGGLRRGRAEGALAAVEQVLASRGERTCWPSIPARTGRRPA